MTLLVDFVNEEGITAYASNPYKIRYNVDRIPLLKQQLSEYIKNKKDEFSLVTVIGKWVVVYVAYKQSADDAVMTFLDFRMEIGEEYLEIFNVSILNSIRTIQARYDTVWGPHLDIFDLQFAPAFPSNLAKEWEAENCINFAIALARLTGWLLHLDVWTNSKDQEENVINKDQIPLRVFVGDNMRDIFDVRGILNLQQFTEEIIRPLAQQKAKSVSGAVSTRVYSERELLDVLGMSKIDESRVEKATVAIVANKLFLDSIPIRQAPLYPAHIASKFTYGYCSPFAEALHAFRNLPVSAMIADEYEPQFGLSKLGYIHSLVLHGDGHGEDSWGKQPIDLIAKRFGVTKYHLDAAKHSEVVYTHRTNAAEKYKALYDEAMEIITKYNDEQ